MGHIALRTLAVIVATLTGSIAAEASIITVKDGQPQAVIVTAENPTLSAQHAAEELQHFVELMSGAKLPIQTDAVPAPTGQALLLVGRSKLVTGVEHPTGNDRDFSREGFVIKSRGNSIILSGNEDGAYHGPEYAVYELLERLGCRWYFPGDFGQVVPKMKTVELPDLDVAQRPSFAVRNIWMSGWAGATGDMNAWLLRNKGTTRAAKGGPPVGFSAAGDGSIQNLVPLAKYAKLFPEIYAMDQNGKRQDETTLKHMTMICMSSAKAVELAAQSIGDYFRANPEANSYGFSAPDAMSICYCPDCQARMHDFQQDSGNMESASDPYFNFVNNLAWAVTKDFPDKYIVTLAYLARSVAPEGLDRPWNQNIIIALANQYRLSVIRPIGTPTDVFALRQQRTVTGWSRITPKMLVRDYDPHTDLSRMPFWRSRAVAADIKFYHQNHVVGFTTEGINTFLRTGMNYYMRARCMWNVDTDPDAVLADFYKRFFGPASAPMQEFGESIETMLQTTPDNFAWQPFNMDWNVTYPPAKIAALAPLLDRAEQLADTPELKQRVKMYRILHNYMTAYGKVYTLQHEGKFKEAIAALAGFEPIIAEAQAIQPGLLPPDTPSMIKRGQSFAHLQARLNWLASRTGGELGDMLGRAAQQAQFLPDPKNIGLYEQWQRNEIDAQLKWLPIDLTRDWGLNGHRDEQGLAYEGIGWYRVVIPIKKPAAGRARLTVPLVFAEKAWVWFNGQLVCSPTNATADPKTGPLPGQATRVNDRGYVTLEIDVHDHLKPDAENIVTFRLQGTLERTGHRGIAEVPFVWATRQ